MKLQKSFFHGVHIHPTFKFYCLITPYMSIITIYLHFTPNYTVIIVWMESRPHFTSVWVIQNYPICLSKTTPLKNVKWGDLGHHIRNLGASDIKSILGVYYQDMKNINQKLLFHTTKKVSLKSGVIIDSNMHFNRGWSSNQN